MLKLFSCPIAHWLKTCLRLERNCGSMCAWLHHFPHLQSAGSDANRPQAVGVLAAALLASAAFPLGTVPPAPCALAVAVCRLFVRTPGSANRPRVKVMLVAGTSTISLRSEQKILKLTGVCVHDATCWPNSCSLSANHLRMLVRTSFSATRLTCASAHSGPSGQSTVACCSQTRKVGPFPPPTRLFSLF